MSANLRENLKPCPFCGGSAELYTDGLTAILCTDCGMSVGNFERSIIKLTDQWNRRAIDKKRLAIRVYARANQKNQVAYVSDYEDSGLKPAVLIFDEA